MSQAELARRVGVSQPTIFKLIHENKSGSRHLHRVAQELKTTAAYLACETDDDSAEVVPEDFTSEERNWIDKLRSVAPEDRKAILRLTRTAAMSLRSSTLHDEKHGYKAADESAAEPARLAAERIKRRGSAAGHGNQIKQRG